MSQVDMVGNTEPELDPDVPQLSRADRRARRDRSRRKRWTLVAVVAAAVVAAIVVGTTGSGLPSQAHASPSHPPQRHTSAATKRPSDVSLGLLPPPASVQAPATIYSQTQLVSDPAVLLDGGNTYIYGTGSPTVAPHVPVRVMNGTTTLSQPTDVMPVMPAWSWGWIWAPDVFKVSNHSYVMWFTSRDVNRSNPDGVNSQCIGNATSASALGPFTASAAPVICQTWGSIDPRSFVAADGSRWMIWKSDTNANHSQVLPTTIWSQQLAADGTTLVGEPTQIAQASQPWEQNLIEAPDMVQAGSKFYLFFSGGSSEMPQAGIGYLVCKGVQGPCTDSRTTPLLASNSQGNGPSEESLFTRNGVTWLLYTPTAIYEQFQYPYLAVARIAFGPNGPYVATFNGANPGKP
ncbi:MAG TPA: glycoside hydrolase family 43 protein [Acidimicrobiales bacterium]|nr:glycoside hydrolase family 43 protein [Acidimicrobiales bacterium]